MRLTRVTLVAVPLWALTAAVPYQARPPLVQGLPADLAKADAAFATRMADTFPPGSSEAALVQRLHAEGFSSDRTEMDPSGAGRARVVLARSACTLTWRVRWRALDGRLISAMGEHDATCL